MLIIHQHIIILPYTPPLLQSCCKFEFILVVWLEYIYLIIYMSSENILGSYLLFQKVMLKVKLYSKANISIHFDMQYTLVSME